MDWLVMSFLLVFFFISLACGIDAVNNAELPIATTSLGSFQGRLYMSRNGLEYPAFLGIKYGTIPQRFQLSIPTEPWEGIKDATKAGNDCAQVNLGIEPTVGNEDCLYLNVYTPKVDNRKRPVLFYVHGGGFNYGSGKQFGGGFLVDEDVILVTINYRLGILGLLNSRSELIPGNVGLKDQLLALQWVNKHIESFGGDPNRVTLNGNSAGSASVFYLMINPAAQGLFSGIYGASGSFLNGWGYLEDTTTYIAQIGKNLNCNAETELELINCLRDANLDNLLVAQKELANWSLDWFKIRPSIEFKNSNNPNPVIEKSPRSVLSDGTFPNIPVLVTVTKDEGIMLYTAPILQNEALRADLNANFSRLAPITFLYDEDPQLQTVQDEVTEAIRQYYLKGGLVTKETESGLTELYSDTYFTRGIIDTVQLLGSKTTVYTGLISHTRKGFSAAEFIGIDASKVEGVSHCDELSYLYDSVNEGSTAPLPILGSLKTPRDVDFSRKFTQLVANFMITGIPKTPFNSKLTWPPVSKQEIQGSTLNWMELDNRDDVSLLINPFGERMNFWKNLLHLAKQKEEL